MFTLLLNVLEKEGFMVTNTTGQDLDIDTSIVEKEDFDVSMNALIEITKRFTSEDAIRPFIRKYPKKSPRGCNNWSMHG